MDVIFYPFVLLSILDQLKEELPPPKSAFLPGFGLPPEVRDRDKRFNLFIDMLELKPLDEIGFDPDILMFWHLNAHQRRIIRFQQVYLFLPAGGFRLGDESIVLPF